MLLSFKARATSRVGESGVDEVNVACDAGLKLHERASRKLAPNVRMLSRVGLSAVDYMPSTITIDTLPTDDS